MLESGKSDAVVVEIESGVIFAHENISQNPERPGRWRNVHSHEPGDALSLAKFHQLRVEDALKNAIN